MNPLAVHRLKRCQHCSIPIQGDTGPAYITVHDSNASPSSRRRKATFLVVATPFVVPCVLVVCWEYDREMGSGMARLWAAPRADAGISLI